jgi:hypothetical protein
MIFKVGFFSFSASFNFVSSGVPSDSTVSEDADNESKTVATSALAVRRSNYSARSPPLTKIIQMYFGDGHAK